MENKIFEIVKALWVYVVYIWEYDVRKNKRIQEYKIIKSFKTLKAAEKYVLKSKWLYEDNMNDKQIVEKLKKCLSYRSYEKLFLLHD